VVEPSHPDAMRSISLVRLVGRGNWVNPQIASGDAVPISLLAVTIKTGRTHQIRVHLSACGHPIAGDDKYGNFEWNRELARSSLKRMFLHAWKLGFLHPQTGESIHLEAQLPPELQQIVGERYFPETLNYN
jgi:23S rRNA pseudouridine955/2504/2580 synthase